MKYNANWGSIYYGDEALLKLGDAEFVCLEARGGLYVDFPQRRILKLFDIFFIEKILILQINKKDFNAFTNKIGQ